MHAAVEHMPTLNRTQSLCRSCDFHHNHSCTNNNTVPKDSDRIQALCEFAPGSGSAGNSGADHTCYWFPFTYTVAHTFPTVCLLRWLSDGDYCFHMYWHNGSYREQESPCRDADSCGTESFLLFRQMGLII